MDDGSYMPSRLPWTGTASDADSLPGTRHNLISTFLGFVVAAAQLPELLRLAGARAAAVGDAANSRRRGGVAVARGHLQLQFRP